MRTIIALTLVLSLAAAAFAQARKPAGPNPGQSIAGASKELDDALQGNDAMLQTAGRQILSDLSKGIDLTSLTDADYALYAQAAVRASLMAGDPTGAMRIADAWVQRNTDTPDPRALRAEIVARMAEPQARGIEIYMGMLNKPPYAGYKPWLDYITPLTKLGGRQPAIALPLEGGATFKTETMGASAAVLYFWALAPAGEKAAAEDLARQNALLTKFGPAGVTVIGINLDDAAAAPAAKKFAADQKVQAVQFYMADNPAACPAPKTIPVMAVPTAVVLGARGRLMFAGDPRVPDVAPVLSCALFEIQQQQQDAREHRGGEGFMQPSFSMAAPDPNVAEAAAQKLYDDSLRKCADQYPTTKYAQQAKDKIQQYTQ
jgi:peroxiredoxin